MQVTVKVPTQIRQAFGSALLERRPLQPTRGRVAKGVHADAHARTDTCPRARRTPTRTDTNTWTGSERVRVSVGRERFKGTALYGVSCASRATARLTKWATPASWKAGIESENERR
jgi:hypothetical protein